MIKNQQKNIIKTEKKKKLSFEEKSDLFEIIEKLGEEKEIGVYNGLAKNALNIFTK